MRSWTNGRGIRVSGGGVEEPLYSRWRGKGLVGCCRILGVGLGCHRGVRVSNGPREVRRGRTQGSSPLPPSPSTFHLTSYLPGSLVRRALTSLLLRHSSLLFPFVHHPLLPPPSPPIFLLYRLHSWVLLLSPLLLFSLPLLLIRSPLYPFPSTDYLPLLTTPFPD